MERAHNPNISRSREAASMNRVLQVALAVTLGSLAGVRIGAGPLNVFAEGRYVSVQTSNGATKFIPLTVGVLFGGGKKK